MPNITAARILIDSDGVISDFVSAFMLLYRNGGGIVPENFAWTEWSSMDALPSQGIRAEVWRDPNLFWIQKPYEGAIEALRKLNDNYDVRIVTAVPHKHVQYRSEWYAHYAPFINRKKQIIFTSDKTLIQGDMIVDDHLPHVYNWLYHNNGTGVIIDRPWNQGEVPYTNLHPRPYPVRMAGLWELVEKIGLPLPEEDKNAETEVESVG